MSGETKTEKSESRETKAEKPVSRETKAANPVSNTVESGIAAKLTKLLGWEVTEAYKANYAEFPDDFKQYQVYYVRIPSQLNEFVTFKRKHSCAPPTCNNAAIIYDNDGVEDAFLRYGK